VSKLLVVLKKEYLKRHVR